MKKLFLILCLSAASINAMDDRAKAQAYIKELRAINESAAAMASKKTATGNDLGDLIAQEGLVHERYENLKLGDPATHGDAMTISDLKGSINDYMAMIEEKISKKQDL